MTRWNSRTIVGYGWGPAAVPIVTYPAFARRFAAEGRTLVFTGDVGRPHDPIMRPPATIDRAGAWAELDDGGTAKIVTGVTEIGEDTRHLVLLARQPADERNAIIDIGIVVFIGGMLLTAFRGRLSEALEAAMELSEGRTKTEVVNEALRRFARAKRRRQRRDGA